MDTQLRNEEILKATQIQKGQTQNNYVLRAILKDYAAMVAKRDNVTVEQVEERIYLSAGTMYVDETTYMSY